MPFVLSEDRSGCIGVNYKELQFWALGIRSAASPLGFVSSLEAWAALRGSSLGHLCAQADPATSLSGQHRPRQCPLSSWNWLGSPTSSQHPLHHRMDALSSFHRRTGMVLDGFPLFELCHWRKTVCSKPLRLPCFTD